MAKPEWGVKRLCAGCGERFYDLNRDPIACPVCGAAFEIEALTRGKRLRAVARDIVAERALETEDVDLVDEDEMAEDDDVAVLEDEDDADEGGVADVAPGAAVEDEDVGVEADDDVLLETEDDDVDAELGDLVEEEPEDDLNR